MQLEHVGLFCRTGRCGRELVACRTVRFTTLLAEWHGMHVHSGRLSVVRLSVVLAGAHIEPIAVMVLTQFGGHP